MGKTADYRQAFELARRDLIRHDLEAIARSGKAHIEPDGTGQPSLFLSYLNRGIKMTWPGCDWADAVSGQSLPPADQVLLLHYLNGALNAVQPQTTGQWNAFQDFPDGRFYQAAFDKRAKAPLIKAFGANPCLLREAAGRIFNADPIEFGDTGVAVQVLPLAAVALVLWAGDAEFPPDGNILFDRNSVRLFGAEDLARLAGRVVLRLQEAGTRNPDFNHQPDGRRFK